MIQWITPFGPTIMKSNLPFNILHKVNEYIDKFDEDPKKFPNMLLRDIDNIFLEKKISDEIGFTKFVENLGNLYLQNIDNPPHNCSSVFLGTSNNLKLDIAQTPYVDAWVNRYYSGDYSPLHEHESVLSGIVFLKIDKELVNEQCNVEQNEQLKSLPTPNRFNGKLEFVMSSGFDMCESTWFPDQKIGNLLLFPSWLSHHTYPFKNNKERRTLSFNLIAK
jgi:hypothetical protein